VGLYRESGFVFAPDAFGGFIVEVGSKSRKGNMQEMKMDFMKHIAIIKKGIKP